MMDVEKHKPPFTFNFIRKTPIKKRAIIIGSKIYESSKEAGRAYGVSPTTIVNRIKRKLPVDGKMYAYYKKEN